MRRALPLLLLVLALPGCGAGATSADDFTGEEARVAETIDDFQAAGQGGDAEEICNQLLARPLVQQLQARGGNCREEMVAALDDADDFELAVQDVAIRGGTARARVEGEGGTRSLTLVREGGRWRISAFG